MLRVSTRAPRRKGFASSLALALAFTAAAGFAAPAQAQSEKPAYSKNFIKQAQAASEHLNAARNKPEVVTELNNLVAASNAISAAQTAKDQAKIAAANAEFETVAKRIQGLTSAEKQELQALAPKAEGPDDKYFVGDLMTFLGTFSGDQSLRAQGLKLKLDSGTLKPESVAPSWFELGQLQFAAHRFDEARTAFEAADKAGDPQGAAYAVETYYSAGRIPEGLDYLEGLIMARMASGQQVPQDWAGNGLTHARDLGDLNRIGHWSALYAAVGNNPKTWNAGISVLLESAKYGLPEQLDAYRLMHRASAMTTEGNYAAYLTAALGPAGVAYPGEVLKIAQEAQQSGTVSRNAAFVADALAKAQNAIDKDKASLPGLVADARKGSGADALDAGDVLLSYDMNAEAEEMYQLALSKGGVDNNRALTRLAIAQVGQNKLSEAKVNFAKVAGTRAPLAAMWVAYIDSKHG